MSYRVEWTPPAQRDVARLPGKIAVAVMAYVDARLALNPRRLSKPLAGDLEGLHGARNGDYRVLLRIDDETTVIWIIRVDHRAHIYRPR
ncbi:MAG: type II toxin-antitoxin system RelE/ParE family toxin [Jatrophihabitans sp.]|nr:MAG: type II toxin-antitoxin system RelE/ParE family toxin [Jatrophihabitans sp.]